MEDYTVQLTKLFQTKTQILASGTVLLSFAVVLLFQSVTLPSGNASPPLFPTGRKPVLVNGSSSNAYPTTSKWGEEVPVSNVSKENSSNSLQTHKEIEKNEVLDDMKSNHENEVKKEDGVIQVNITIESERIENSDNNSKAPLSSPPLVYHRNGSVQGMLEANSTEALITEKNPKNEQALPLERGISNSTVNFTIASAPRRKKDKRWRKLVVPTKSTSEMNSILLRNHASPDSLIPLWPSDRDNDILDAKAKILNAPIVKNDQELYALLYRNISAFKRSYELMEEILKVYIYKEREKPIFHQPLLDGIYASEGWFMKLMEGNTHFVVQDPRKAHMFYMPFSSRLLEISLHVPGRHHNNLIKHLDDYVNEVASKYPFWNRTSGEDHFLAACHDWAPHVTGQNMANSIRALCNADLSESFEIGKDVSLPETYVRLKEDPLKDIGGKSARKRPTLAFFSGQMHGYLRPILLQHWENKDPDMKIFGPMPRGSKKKNAYIQYMKTSKYCICPRGYEVNSPRIVEAIFYECVPVIISDNFVPPFFEVLNWESFSVIVAEKDVPRLKEILVSIPMKKYLSLQMRVRKVQQHFLWHKEPVKYDLFHMILHSIWFNRVNQIRIN